MECYKLNDSFDNVECCFDIVAVFGNNVAGFGNSVERNFVLSTKSEQIKHVQFDRGITAENMEKSQHTDFNKDTTNESASVVCTAVKAGHSESIKKHVLTPLR